MNQWQDTTNVEPSIFTGCDFFGAVIDGDVDEPTVLGDPKNGNIQFPRSWNRAQADRWRAENNVPRVSK